VSGDYLSLLDARAVAGRPIGPDDDRPGAAPVVAIGEQFWRRHFDADPAIVGRVLTLNGVPRTVVGVISAAFNGSFVAAPVDAWTPFASSSRELAANWQTDRTRRHLLILARLQPDLTLDGAAARVQDVTSAFADVPSSMRLNR